MPEFLLSEDFLNAVSIEIDEARFYTLIDVNKVIKSIWDVEEAFSLLSNAFIELEEYLLSAGLNYYYQRDMQRDVDHFFDDVRQIVNLKLISALTASRVYEEQLYRRMSFLSKLTGTDIDLRQNFSSVFDESLEYRVMYALRNHALHNQLPLGTITFGGSNLSETGDICDDAPSRLRTTVNPKISVAEFCSSDKIRPATKEEVKELGFKHLDLKFFARGFLSGLARCHEDFRSATEGFLEEALERLSEAHNELESVKGDDPKHVSIFKLDGGCKVEGHYIDYKSKSRIKALRKFWTGLKWVQRAYISSEVKVSNDTYPQAHDKIWIAK